MKIEKNVQNSYLTNYNLLTVQDIWETHYQILLIILLKEFRMFNPSMDRVLKNSKCNELNLKNGGCC